MNNYQFTDPDSGYTYIIRTNDPDPFYLGNHEINQSHEVPCIENPPSYTFSNDNTTRLNYNSSNLSLNYGGTYQLGVSSTGIRSETIEPRYRQLSMDWTIESPEDIRTEHNTETFEELASIMSQEIDREIELSMELEWGNWDETTSAKKKSNHLTLKEEYLNRINNE